MAKGTNTNREFWESADGNKLGYVSYYNRLIELSVSMFDWKNLPPEIDVRYLELTLFAKGRALFFFDEALGDKGEYIALQCTNAGALNIYNIPKKRMAFAPNGYHRWLDDTNSVLIYNNYLHQPSNMTIEMFARRLWDIDRAIDVNIKAQKTPILIKADQTELQTLKNIYMKYQGNEPVIFGTKGINDNSISVLSTNAPYVADRLQTAKTEIWNEALTYLGISNLNTVKKERLITDEVNRNLGGTMASRYSRLYARKEACKQINKMFGLNIDVEYREDMKSITANLQENMLETEGDDE